MASSLFTYNITTMKLEAKPLTETELEVLANLCADMTVGDVAKKMHMSTSTVWTHMRHARMKLGVKTNFGMVARFLRNVYNATSVETATDCIQQG